MPIRIHVGVFARPLAVSAALLLAGCATVDTRAGFSDMQRTVGDRMRQQAVWRSTGPEDAGVTATIADLMKQPLSLEGAVQVGLLGNQELQATYAQLGIGQADLAQAGLLSNPLFNLSVRPTVNPAAMADLEFGLVQSFLDVLMRPARKRVAAAAFEEIKLQVGAEVVSFVADVQSAYFNLQAALNAKQLLIEIADSTAASAALAERFHAAGNISDLRWKEESTAAEDAAVAVIAAEQAVDDAREEFGLLLGVTDQSTWSVPDTLPAPPTTELALAGIEGTALGRRLDVAAARQNLEVELAVLKSTTDWRLWKSLDIGAIGTRDGAGQWSVGPDLQFALPLFDQGRPAVTRAAVSVLRAQNQLRAVEFLARSEVRRAASQLSTAYRRVDRYRSVIIPLKQNIVALKQQEYNYMLIGAFEVLLAKKDETAAYLDYIHAVSDYWRARVELDRALGGGSSAAATIIAGGAS